MQQRITLSDINISRRVLLIKSNFILVVMFFNARPVVIFVLLVMRAYFYLNFVRILTLCQIKLKMYLFILMMFNKV